MQVNHGIVLRAKVEKGASTEQELSSTKPHAKHRTEDEQTIGPFAVGEAGSKGAVGTIYWVDHKPASAKGGMLGFKIQNAFPRKACGVRAKQAPLSYRTRFEGVHQCSSTGRLRQSE